MLPGDNTADYYPPAVNGFGEKAATLEFQIDTELMEFEVCNDGYEATSLTFEGTLAIRGRPLTDKQAHKLANLFLEYAFEAADHHLWERRPEVDCD